MPRVVADEPKGDIGATLRAETRQRMKSTTSGGTIFLRLRALAALAAGALGAVAVHSLAA
jgi:hypothetical protein